MKIAKVAGVIAVAVGCLLAGCDQWAGVEAGEYVVDAGAVEAGAVELRIDRSQGAVVFALSDGSQIATSVTPRDRATWPAGCPTNVYSTRMEVLDLGEETLVVGSVTFSNPILVRDCPSDPVRVVLREDGPFDQCCTACPSPQMKCVHFRLK